MRLLILKTLILSTRFLNLVFYYLYSFVEKFKGISTWTKELAQYFRTTPEKVLANYQQKRIQAAQLWGQKNRQTQKQIQSFYQETDYFVYRQNYFHRFKLHLDIALALLIKKTGKFCEYGGGVAPITNRLIKFFPKWQYHVSDLDCPVLDFAKWRFRNYSNVSFSSVKPHQLPLKEKYDVIVVKQVLEHVTNPLKVTKHLVDHLKPNGFIYLDFINEPGEENIAKGAQQRRKVLQYLKDNLISVFHINPDNNKEGYGLYLKQL